MESAQKLQTNLDYIFDKFIEKVEQKTEKIAAIKNERLQKKMAEDLDKEIESFIKMKDKLVENFQAIRRSVNFSSYKVYGGTKKSSKPTPNLIPFF